MIEASSCQNNILAWAVPMRAFTYLMLSARWDLQLHWLNSPGDPVGVIVQPGNQEGSANRQEENHRRYKGTYTKCPLSISM